MRGGDGRARVVVAGIRPLVDCGRFPIKRAVGDEVAVEADVFVDGHDLVRAAVVYRHEGEQEWSEALMERCPGQPDRWRASFVPEVPGRYRYTVAGWVDRYGTWTQVLRKRIAAGQDVGVELKVGAALLREGAGGASGRDALELDRRAAVLSAGGPGAERLALAAETAALARRNDPRLHMTRCEDEFVVVVEPARARFSAWYELFPRSTGGGGCQHGTFRTAAEWLPYVGSMGFDVLYLPPIHPIGVTHRKGRNNTPFAGPDDPGSPWAIGSSEGGHRSVNPRLGSLDEFRWFVGEARRQGLEVALDLAFQASPDHPLVKEHPGWFRARPDGSIRYAENPPKKYEDIVPFDFESEDWEGLWRELQETTLFWVEQGVTIFRVDNPHTKPLAFWEWLIGEVKRKHPEVIFLAEAFTRPTLLHALAKRGFSQSYTYFAWRNDRAEIEAYLGELMRSEAREYLRANLWANTPDILTEYLQTGGPAAFRARAVLAATLGANYGVYGPAFELCEATPREAGSEEYLDSEKYEVREWDVEGGESLRELFTRLNRIRREHPALQQDWTLEFHPSDNEEIICYSKNSPDLEDLLIMVVNLDPHHSQQGHVELNPQALHLDPVRPFQMQDLLGDGAYLWHGRRNSVQLGPGRAYVLEPRRRVRSEQDFEYFA